MKMEYNMNLNRNNSDEGQNGLWRVSNPGSVALTGLAFEIGHGINRGINPIALGGISTSGPDILVKICLIGRAVRIYRGVGTKNTGKSFRTI